MQTTVTKSNDEITSTIWAGFKHFHINAQKHIKHPRKNTTEQNRITDQKRSGPKRYEEKKRRKSGIHSAHTMPAHNGNGENRKNNEIMKAMLMVGLYDILFIHWGDVLVIQRAHFSSHTNNR